MLNDNNKDRTYLSELDLFLLRVFCTVFIFLVGVKGLIDSLLASGGATFWTRLPPLEKSEPRGENFLERVGDRRDMTSTGDVEALKEPSCSCSALRRL